MEPSLFTLFAQQMVDVPASGGFPTQVLILPIIALLIPIVIVPTALGIRYARQAREMEHREKMKALEVGRPMPGEEPEASPMAIASKIGAGVPAGAMGIAWLANLTIGRGAETAWTAAGCIAVPAILCGTFLALKAMGISRQADHATKPAFDPDAYDHVGTRG